MPTLHIEFDPTGGNNFLIKYKEVGTQVWSETSISGSPADITVPNVASYEYCIYKVCNVGNNSIPICGIAEYIPPCNVPNFSFDHRDNNNFYFNYTLGGNQPQFDLEVTHPNGNTVITRYQASNMPSPFMITIQGMVSGTYRFRFRGVCGSGMNAPYSDWTNYVDVAVTVSTCQQPSAIMLSGATNTIVASLSWNDTLTNENRICNSSSCTSTMKVSATNSDNSITNIKVLYSDDGGLTWAIIISNISNNGTFGDTISDGVHQFKIIATDVVGNTQESNILTIQHLTPEPILNDYYYESIWSSDDTLHNTMQNSWVDYEDQYGTTQRHYLGGIEYGCQLIQAVSIIATSGANTCIP